MPLTSTSPIVSTSPKKKTNKKQEEREKITFKIYRKYHKIAKIEAIKSDINIGEWIEQAIQEKSKQNKLTQADLAKRLGVTASYISQVRNGKAEPSPDFIKKLIDVVKD